MQEQIYKIKNIFENRKSDVYDEVGSRRAAVLVPLVEVKNELHILFEVRSQDLEWQPGEICFPGGRVDREDKTYEDTATRETCEELLIVKNSIKVYGELDFIAAQMGVIVYPFVGKISDFGLVKVNENEVKEVFTVPLDFLWKMKPREAELEVMTKPLDVDNFPYDLLPGYERGPRRRKTYKLYFYVYKDYVIWGLTAQILKNFLDTIKKFN